MAAPSTGEGLTCSLRAILPLVNLFERRGLPTDAVLAKAGIDAAQLGDPDLRFPAADFLAAWTLAEQVSGDKALGLHAAEALDPTHTAMLA